MVSRETETICALSSGGGRAGIAVIRASGSAAGEALRVLAGGELPVPRQASLRAFRDPHSGEVIDHGLALWFPGPASFTGEDLAEFHVHGGRAVVGALLEALTALPGCRLAEAGEFTRRAFDAGKLDLTEVEGLADLIAAETEAQRRLALRQMEGALSVQAAAWRERLLRVLAHLEASIDFSEEDLPDGILAGLGDEITAVIEALRAQLADARRGERLRDGFQVAILGPPNAGKSSLLNAIARRDVAIVSETAGTTRDVIEVHLDLAGYPVTLADTAGLRELAEGGDEVERAGISRSLARAEAADLRLLVLDRQTWPKLDEATLGLGHAKDLAVLNKSDLPAPQGFEPGCAASELETLCLSARSGAGLDGLLAKLSERVSEAFAGFLASPTVSRARQREALGDCLAGLERADLSGPPELAAEELRLALRALGRLTGQFDVEELLDVIFADFCIGK